MKLNMRAKMLLLLAAIVAVAGIACGIRSMMPTDEDAQEPSAAEVQDESMEPTAEVESISEEAAALIGGPTKAADLQSAVEQWCAKTVPEAESCKWDKTVKVDYTTDTVTYGFVLDDAEMTKISAAVNRETGRTTVTKAVR